MKGIGVLKMLAIAAAFCLILTGCNRGSDETGIDDTSIGVRASQISVGVGPHTMVIGEDGSLWAWGSNNWGQLGDGTIVTHRSRPTRIGEDNDWASVSAGGQHTVAIKTDGSLWAWGNNERGQLGDGSMGVANYRNVPFRIGADSNWTSVSAGGIHTVGIREDGSLWTWGNNGQGQLGIGSTGSFIPVPVQVQAGTTWATASAGWSHNVAIRTDGSLWAWGDNFQGRLGDGTSTLRNTPVRIGTDNDWAFVSAGSSHTMAIREGGTLWAWGFNGQGRLGDGTTTNRFNPVQIYSGTIWTSVAAGDNHNMAIMQNGTLWAWGFNGSGQLGDGTAQNRSFPMRVRTESEVPWASMSAGESHSLAIGADGTIWAWGSNGNNQLGDGTTTDRHTKIRVMPSVQ
jgi:alpha-tubulin suppressor-like RCC1 family protein